MFATARMDGKAGVCLQEGSWKWNVAKDEHERTAFLGNNSFRGCNPEVQTLI